MDISMNNNKINITDSNDVEIGVIKANKEESDKPENIALANKIFKNKGFVIGVLVLILAIIVVYKLL